MSPQQRRALPCIGNERADLVVAGCAILEAILDIWPAPRLGVADRGIREGIKGDGSLWGDVDGWNSKQNQWKNGYHETEHAVIMYLMSQARNKQPATLYFAVPLTQLSSFKPQPYLFGGEAYKIEPLAYLDDLGLVQVRVTFRNIR